MSFCRSESIKQKRQSQSTLPSLFHIIYISLFSQPPDTDKPDQARTKQPNRSGDWNDTLRLTIYPHTIRRGSIKVLPWDRIRR